MIFSFFLNPNPEIQNPKLTAEAVPKLSISLVGHGFSRAKILAIICFENLKVNPMECETIPSRVCPTLKNRDFDPASAKTQRAQRKRVALGFVLNNRLAEGSPPRYIDSENLLFPSFGNFSPLYIFQRISCYPFCGF